MSADREPAGSPITPLGGTPRGPSAGVALALVGAAVMAAIVIAVVSSPAPLPAPSLALASPSAAAPSASPLASLRPSPGIDAPATTVIVLRGVADPAAALAGLAACAPLVRVHGQPSAAIKGADVDTAAASAGRDGGWLFVPPGIQAVTRVWLGDDVVELAQAAGRQLVAVGIRGDVWLGGKSGATLWRPVATPKGRTAWVMTNDEVTGGHGCGSWSVPESIAGQRSVDCSGIGVDACLRLASKVGVDVPELAFAGGDLGITGAQCRPRIFGCTAIPSVAVAIPRGWQGDAGAMRAATPISPDGVFTELLPAVVPQAALDSVALPALPLPVSAAPATACSTTVTGQLRGSPWDSRVAWVGSDAVVWPAGTIVEFTPALSLTLPTADGSVRFARGAPVSLRGALDERTKAFVACVPEHGTGQS